VAASAPVGCGSAFWAWELMEVEVQVQVWAGVAWTKELNGCFSEGLGDLVMGFEGEARMESLRGGG
jgi:hypothetical protein